MYGCGLQDLFNSKTTDGLGGRFIGDVVKGTLLQKHQDKWTVSIESMPKLRTFKTLNTIYSVQPYLKNKHFSTRKISDCTFKMWCASFAYWGPDGSMS